MTIGVFVRAALMVLVLAALAACGPLQINGKALIPVPSSLVSRMNSIGSSSSEAMLVRIFKQDSSLEVWKRTRDGTYKFLKAYEICSWSGELGPKIKEGDRQSPEGFYTITPGLMNPNSSYFLAFNTGYPNKFDRAYGRTGSELMVHGDCSSRGCYAMTDAQIAEIFAMARDAFRGGQRNFQLQIYPFHLTVENLAKHRDNPNIDFWRNLKEGYDSFEISHRLPDWDVCRRRYVFNAKSSGPLDPNGACPTESTDPQLMAAVQQRQIDDAVRFDIAAAELDKKDADRAVAEANRVADEAAMAERTAALNAAVKESTDSFGNSVSSFFGNIFGLGPTPTATPPDVKAPIPMPRIKRG